MSQTEADFYKAVGFFRANGLSEAQAYSRAEEGMEAAGGNKEFLGELRCQFTDEEGSKP
jgi:hypothetical protein